MGVQFLSCPVAAGSSNWQDGSLQMIKSEFKSQLGLTFLGDKMAKRNSKIDRENDKKRKTIKVGPLGKRSSKVRTR
jgi:hypothetical protein